MYKNKETISKENTYKAFLIYSLVAGVGLISIVNYMENCKFNNELQKQIKLCKKMIKKREKLHVEI